MADKPASGPPPWVVGIRRPGETLTVATGVLVSEEFVVTTAHFAGTGTEPPAGGIVGTVDFPALPGSSSDVLLEEWSFSKSRDLEAFAILRISGSLPPGVQPCRIADGWTPGGAVSSFGFPDGSPGRIRGQVAGVTPEMLIKLDIEGGLVSAGMSGAPVSDVDTNDVIGIITGREREGTTTYVLPFEAMAEQSPTIRRLLDGQRRQESQSPEYLPGFSSSVTSVREALGAQELVSAGQIAAELQKSHPGYGAGLFASVAVVEDGPVRTTDAWLTLVRSMYDLEEVAGTRHRLVDGELMIAALALLDEELANALADGDFLDALRADIGAAPALSGVIASEVEELAVLVSMTAFDSDSVTTLPGQTDAVENLATLLSDWGFAVEVIADQRRSEVLASLETALAKAGPSSRLLLYWGGHAGLIDGSVQLVARDSDASRAESMIDVEDLGRVVAQASWGRILLMLDAAYAGAASSALLRVLTEAPTEDLQPPDIARSGMVLVSAGAGEVPHEREFVEAVVVALEPGDEGNRWARAGEYIDGIDLAQEIERSYQDNPDPRHMEWLTWGDVSDLLTNHYWRQEPSFSDYIKPSADVAASRDRLRREFLATTVADQLVAVRPELGDEQAFGLIMDGPWGSGKTSLLNLLEDDLKKREGTEADWLPIRFDAWRESQVGPAWWSLTNALGAAIRPGVSRPDRIGLWARSKLRLVGRPFLAGVGIAVLALIAAIIAIVVADVEVSLTRSDKLVGLLASSLAILGTLWAAGRAVTRALSLQSSARAKQLEQSSGNPTDRIVGQIDLLLKCTCATPVLMIDDLDRCSHSYVVELLDAIQTLIRTPQSEVSADRESLFFIVAADGRWVRAAYENAHAQFLDTIGEPGKPLGYLFTEKLFQIAVPVPALSDRQREAFLRFRLLGDTAPDAEGPLQGDQKTEAVQALTAQIETARTPDEIAALAAEAPSDVRDAVFDTAIEQARKVEGPKALEHNLERYHSMLPPNPRAITRFVMAYAVTRAARRAENRWLPTDPLARWVVIRTRWPALADFLASHPEAVRVGGPSLPEELKSIPDIDEAALILTEDGDPFTVARLRECAGTSAPNQGD